MRATDIPADIFGVLREFYTCEVTTVNRQGQPITWPAAAYLVLRVTRFVTANGRTDTDEMPHASSPWHMVQFFWLGWRNTRAYLAKRGTPWPPIPFAAIARKLDI